MEVEVAYALPDVQRIVRLDLEVGTSLRQALVASGLLEEFSLELDDLAVGVFGERQTDLDRPLAEQDRVEIYRPLLVEPRSARHLRQHRNPADA